MNINIHTGSNSPTSPVAPVSPAVNLQKFVIHENKEEENDVGVPLSAEEKMSMMSATLAPIPNDTAVLWDGKIFETVQSLRHFKDSKSFVDHVLKTFDLNIVNEHFKNNIENYNSSSLIKQKTMMKTSQSFGHNLGKLNQLRQLSNTRIFAVNKGGVTDEVKNNENQENDKMPPTQTYLPKRSSFPRIAVNNKYHSIMDEFIDLYFFKPGFELLAGQTPIDWKSVPNTSLFQKTLVPENDDDLNTQFLFDFALELNRLWKLLYRVVNKNVSNQSHRYSFIPLKHPSVFVPGGRFREIYYWDSYWIICGLLCCGMVQSSVQLVENMIDLVERFGHVPNGTRKYYISRSQPPLLTLMVKEIFKVSSDKIWLKSILPSLVKEYEYWTKEPVEVTICDENNKQYKFSRYYSSVTKPRPESYYEDRMSTLITNDDKEKDKIYQNIRAAAASGWDFSSRWYFDKNGAYGNNKIEPRSVDFNLLNNNDNMNVFISSNYSLLNEPMDDTSNLLSDAALSVNEEVFDEFAQQRMNNLDFSLSYLDTVSVIPVDLNIFLAKVEGAISDFYKQVGNKKESEKFKSYQLKRIDSILAVLWDENNKQFRDWNFRLKCFGNLNNLSNFSALWLSCDEHELFNKKKEEIVESLTKSSLICPGGIVTTLFETGEQWDYPNCWPCLNSIIIDGLYEMGKYKYSLKIANLWINNNYHTYLQTKKMHEKYHCQRYGTGGGGEYKPQTGFGWTNGVCLTLLHRFGREIKILQK